MNFFTATRFFEIIWATSIPYLIVGAIHESPVSKNIESVRTGAS